MIAIHLLYNCISVVLGGRGVGFIKYIIAVSEKLHNGDEIGEKAWSQSNLHSYDHQFLFDSDGSFVPHTWNIKS